MRPVDSRRTCQRVVAMAGLVLGLSLDLDAGSTLQAAEYHDQVVIVLDASGSMAGGMGGGSGQPRMAAAKAALKEVLKNVPASTHVGLLVFSAKNTTNDWVHPLGPRNETELFRGIDRLQPGTGTPLGAYIKKGADRLLQARAEQFGYGSYRLLVVTDGEAGDQNLVERYTPEVMARGITVDVIGVAMNRAHTLATKVHSYRAANDPESLRKAIADVFAEVSGTSKDVMQGEAFELLAPIPVEVASAMIQALGTTGNQPIGERPRNTAAAAAPRAASGPSAAPAVPVTINQPSGASNERPAFSKLLFLLIIVVIGLRILTTLIRFVTRSGRKHE